jgi:hypothetical protein
MGVWGANPLMRGRGGANPLIISNHNIVYYLKIFSLPIIVKYAESQALRKIYTRKRGNM